MHRKTLGWRVLKRVSIFFFLGGENTHVEFILFYYRLSFNHYRGPNRFWVVTDAPPVRINEMMRFKPNEDAGRNVPLTAVLNTRKAR